MTSEGEKGARGRRWSEGRQRSGALACLTGRGEKGGRAGTDSALAACGARHSWPRVKFSHLLCEMRLLHGSTKATPGEMGSWRRSRTGNGTGYPVVAQHSFSAVLNARVCVYTRSAISRSPAPREFPGEGFRRHRKARIEPSATMEGGGPFWERTGEQKAC